MASIFLVSTRTVNRWETFYGISAERKNARVLRYPIEWVVRLVAFGLEINIEEAGRLGLHPNSILALAASVAPQTTPASSFSTGQPVPLAAEDDDDRRLMTVWRDSDLGPVLRKIVRALSDEPVASANQCS